MPQKTLIPGKSPDGKLDQALFPPCLRGLNLGKVEAFMPGPRFLPSLCYKHIADGSDSFCSLLRYNFRFCHDI